MVRSWKVAVIGAGPAGLVAARELRSEGHRVVVFEKSDRLGGTWVYDPRVETDPLGLDPGREIVHSSLYCSLRINIPRHIMGFSDFPFVKRENRDPRVFPGHEEVLLYLNDFARNFGLVELIKFCTEVVRVEQVNGRKDEWIVKTRTPGSELEEEEEVFEAVVVCNGHNTVPRIAEIPGIERWPGEQIHSHNYRTPEPFRDQIVVLIGNGPSVRDISREISKVAKEVHLASRSADVKVGKLINHDNIWHHSMIEYVSEDSKVVFHDGSLVYADLLLHCTGYKYHFSFLETNGIISADDNRVGPLYKHVFPPRLAPSVSFVGLASKVLSFVTFELQSKWIAQVLSGKVLLPSEEEVMVSVEDFYQYMHEIGRPKHYTHVFNHNQDKFDYKNWLAAEVGLPPIEEWVEQMFVATIMLMSYNPDGFRDHWDEDIWIQQYQSSIHRLL